MNYLCDARIAFTDDFHLIFIVKGYKVQLGKGCPGNNIFKAFIVTSSTECGALCNKFCVCAGFVFNGKFCTLKSKCVPIDKQERGVYIRL